MRFRGPKAGTGASSCCFVNNSRCAVSNGLGCCTPGSSWVFQPAGGGALAIERRGLERGQEIAATITRASAVIAIIKASEFWSRSDDRTTRSG